MDDGPSFVSPNGSFEVAMIVAKQQLSHRGEKPSGALHDLEIVEPSTMRNSMAGSQLRDEMQLLEANQKKEPADGTNRL